MAELVKLNVDVLVLGAPPAIRAARQATKTIPIVIVTTSDPVEAGFMESLARPGGTMTGMTFFSPELAGKRVELLERSRSDASRVGVLW